MELFFEGLPKEASKPLKPNDREDILNSIMGKIALKDKYLIPLADLFTHGA